MLEAGTQLSKLNLFRYADNNVTCNTNRKASKRAKEANASCAARVLAQPPSCVKQHNKAALSPAHRDLSDKCGALCGQTILVSSSSMPRSQRSRRGRRYRSPTLNSFRMQRGNGGKKRMCSKFTSMASLPDVQKTYEAHYSFADWISEQIIMS